MRGHLKSLVESHGVKQTALKLKECLKEGHIKSEDISLRECAEAFLGYDWDKKLSNSRYVNQYQDVSLEEASGEAVDLSAFSNITGQIVYTEIEKGWKRTSLISEKLFRPLNTEFIDEKLPWIGHIKELPEGIHMGDPYPEASLGERYVQTNNLIKKGQILSLYKETVEFDRTGQLVAQANKVGEQLGYLKEIQCLRMVLGIDNPYNLNGVSYNTFSSSGGQSIVGASGGNGQWTNYATNQPLVDYTSINQAKIMFSTMTDPDSGVPLMIEPKQLVVMPGLEYNARRIVNATETRNISPAFSATTGFPNPPQGNVEMIAPSPVEGLEVISGNLLWYVANTNQSAVASGGGIGSNIQSIWLIGDFKEGLIYRQRWPLTMSTAPAGNIKEFEQDIVMRWKASEFGAPMVLDPRHFMIFTN